MDKTIRHLLNLKQMGMVLFDNRFRIVEMDITAETLLSRLSASSLHTHLLEVFPELIGMESVLMDVLHNKAVDCELDYINRVDANNQRWYLRLLVLREASGLGLLTIEDITQQARVMQEMNQQKYALLLAKSRMGSHEPGLSDALLGDSIPIRQVRDTISQLRNAPSATVLLLGETGTGKSLAARLIHYHSMPMEAPFVDINCAALPANLMESELFGYEKGAFTDATTSRAGLIEEAQGGTIFLDEIAELPLNLQSKLLSSLEEKKIRRLGSNRPIAINARIISATNRDLNKELAEKRFREDLYYRLNVVTIVLPPLRSLGDDILTIADHLLDAYNIEFKKRVEGFTQDAEKKLSRHTWPGNVRELRNCLERTMIFIQKSRIEASDLEIFGLQPSQPEQPWVVPTTGIKLEDVEYQLIHSAVDQADGNKSKAARLLGISIDTLRYRLKKYGEQ